MGQIVSAFVQTGEVTAVRIWVLTNEYDPWFIGGLGVVATQLSRAVRDLGEDVTVIARGKGPPRLARNHAIRVLRIPRRKPFFHEARRRFNTEPILFAARRRAVPWPDLIHVHSVGFANLALHMQESRNIPVVYTCHSLICDEPWSPHQAIMKRRQERLLRKADRIVVPSEWQRQGIMALYPQCAERIRVISNGVDLPGQVNWQHSLLVERRAPGTRLLFVGRLIPQKGIEELLQSIAVLRQRGWPVTLDIVGRGGMQYKARLVELAGRLQVSQHVRWLGFQPAQRMADIYRAHDLVIVPSQLESFGLVALEAMAWGVPLVSTQSGGLSDFIDSNVAHIIPSVDRYAIADVVENTLLHPDEVVERAKEGRSRSHSYTWNSVAERYLVLFQELTSSRQGVRAR